MGRSLTRRCRNFSVVLNFKEPGGQVSSMYCRLVMVKLRVKGTRGGLVAATGEGEKSPH